MLADTFWPGSLTLVLPRDQSVPAVASGGRDTLAVRCPGHDVALELLAAFGGPISAPSANRSGSVSPTTAQHVQQDYDHVEEAEGLLVLDGGPCSVGIESTVLDLSGDAPRVLRPGSITSSQLSALIGPVERTLSTEQGASPGTSLRHYAPATPVELVDAGAAADRLAECAGRVVVISSGSCECDVENTIELPETPGGYAESIYSALREADGMNLDRILIIRPGGDQPGWEAVIDRITRASRMGEHDD
jgi:L-threonylcarbamoyladenylate synthase